MVRPPDFEALYAADPDPWKVRDSWYERRKEAVLLALLSRERYEHSWDAACGTGALARALAGRSGRVTATDASSRAVRLTEHLLSGLPATTALVSRLPGVPPLADAPDLVVLSEVLYYLPDEERAQSLDAVATAADEVAEIVVVHWRHHPDDAFLPGAAATEEADTRLRRGGWTRHTWHDDPDFVAASWVRP
jgi:SAM-dependent methyltransferase